MVKRKDSSTARGHGAPDRAEHALLVLPDQHPIVSTSFDVALRSPSLLLDPVRVSGAEQLTALLSGVKKTKGVARLISAVRRNDKVTLVLSKEAQKGIREGGWGFPIDKKTGLLRADLRNARGQLTRPVKFKPEQLATRAIRGAMALAHVVSAMDVQAQLQDISAKLDRIVCTLSADRLGQLRGVYISLQKALSDSNAGRRTASLRGLSRDLDKLEAQYLENAKAEFASISDPAAIGIVTAIFSRQSTAEQKLRTELGSAMGHLRMAEFCHQLGALVHVALDEQEQLIVHRGAFVAACSDLCELVVEKSSYLDLNLSKLAKKKIRLLEKAWAARPAINTATGQILLQGEAKT